MKYVDKEKKFRELDKTENKQEGDILYWEGHMAIFSSFNDDTEDAKTDRIGKKGNHWTQVNDMWTATHPGGPAYQPGKMAYFKSSEPRVFRYQK